VESVLLICFVFCGVAVALFVFVPCLMCPMFSDSLECNHVIIAKRLQQGYHFH
jgi:hypothetical protein